MTFITVDDGSPALSGKLNGCHHVDIDDGKPRLVKEQAFRVCGSGGLELARLDGA